MRDLDAAEEGLRAALEVGDPDLINPWALEVDRLQPAPREPSILGSALWYAGQGLPVFPLQPGSKVPWPRSHGFKDATTDRDVIADWFAPGRPPSNLGMATGARVDVVDIDGLLGQLSRVREWDMFARLDVLAVVSTPRAGGMHLWVPASGEGNKAGLLPGIDYRGDGGYVVVPPSSTPEGTYRFIRPPNLGANT